MVFSSFIVFLYPLCFYGTFTLPFDYVVLDEVSYVLLYITVLVMLVSYFSQSFSFSHYFASYLTFISLLICSLVVFVTSNFLVLYVFFEASLVPISYVILKWGVYPDRQLSALVMLLFTSVFTFPISVLVLLVWVALDSFSFVLVSFDLGFVSLFSAIWILLAFSVKLPLYGLHYWLPMAHVEAPTFGSIVLAGLLLNLGGCGLMRFFIFMSLHFDSLVSIFFGYLIVAIVVCAYVCNSQSDIKRLVAYSSVLHMSIVVIIFLCINILSYKVVLMLIVFHGLSSPLLFSLVGVLYQFYGSRLIVLLRGGLLLSPLLSFFVLLSFLVNVPVPPLPAFLAEVAGFLSMSGVSLYAVYILVPSVMFLVLSYGLLWSHYVMFSYDKLVSTSSFYTSISSFLLFFIMILPSFAFVFLSFIF